MGLLRSPYAYGAPFDPYAQQPNPMLPQSVTPFVAQQQTQGQGAGPTFAPPLAAPPAPTAQPTFGERMNGFFNGLQNNGALNLGLSLLGNARGSNWGQVAQDMQRFNAYRMAQQRADNEERRATAAERRAETQFGWQNTERDRVQGIRQRTADWAQGRGEFAQINPDAAYEAEAEAQALTNQPITPYQQQALELQRRGLAIDAARGGHQTLTPAQERLYRNDYTNFQQDLADQVGGVVMGSMPYALQIAAGGAPPPGMSRDQVLISDQGLLRAVARLQTGPGVLTEGEVRDTVGNDIYNRLQSQGASFRLNERLRPEVRDGLARMVQQGVRRVSTRAWDARENALAAYQSTTGRNPAGWGLPQFSHPADIGSLYQAERIAGQNGAPPLRPNDTRIAPSGRRYTYVGPGNWLPSGEGDVAGYQAGREQRLSRADGRQPQAPTQEQQRQGSQYGDALPSPADFPEGHRLENDNGIVVVKRNGVWVRDQTIQGRGGASRPLR